MFCRDTTSYLDSEVFFSTEGVDSVKALQVKDKRIINGAQLEPFRPELSYRSPAAFRRVTDSTHLKQTIRSSAELYL